MIFKGHQKSSFIDYKDKISTVVFTGGCNFRCKYCHNAQLVYNDGDTITEEEIIKYLNKRKKMIDAICVSGGEPTLHKDLPNFIKKAKEIGYLVKLDTNGTNPAMLRDLLETGLLDYVAMDVKAPFDKYNKIIAVDIDINKIKESIDIVMNLAPDYEFRTTIVKELLNNEDIYIIANSLKGANRYILQNFRDRDTVLIGEGKLTSYTKEELDALEKMLAPMFNNFGIRK